MIYSVKMDGFELYGINGKDSLIDPKCEIELNSAGSVSFKMPYMHPYFNLPKPLLSNVEIFENGKSIWFGRVISVEINLNNEKEVECEGCLAFFNDSIQRPEEFAAKNYSIKDFFRTVIANHNMQVAQDRRFSVRNIDIDEKFVYRKLDYETTFECLEDMCLNAEGGYFATERKNDVVYIDWLKKIDKTANQDAKFGLNITDISQILDARDVKTRIIPIGKEDENGIRATCKEANNGYDYIDTKLKKKYGVICTVIEFPDLTNPKDLVEAANKWIKDYEFDPLSLEVDVSELAYIDKNYTPFMVGQKVHITSTPHLIDKYLPIVKMSIELDSSSKSVTIGTVAKRKLTEIYKDESK